MTDHLTSAWSSCGPYNQTVMDITADSQQPKLYLEILGFTENKFSLLAKALLARFPA